MYIIDSGGLDTDKYYPYKERVSQCSSIYQYMEFPQLISLQQYLCKFSSKHIAGKCTGR